jgi:hypothetical protein
MTQLLIQQLRAQARAYARAGKMKHRVALDHLARQQGFSHWNGLLGAQAASLVPRRPEGISSIPIPPAPLRKPPAPLKRPTRYRSDSQFREAVDAELARAIQQTQAGGWITYAIQDPSKPDLFGDANGLLVYVGQSKEFGKRVRNWMRLAGSATTEPADEIAGFLYRIMASGFVPRFLVLDRTASALDSLVSEANHARRLVKNGYPLANKWKEHREDGPSFDRYSVPTKRLWDMTWEDASASRIQMVLICKEIGLTQIVDLSVWPPKMRLNQIRKHSLERAQKHGHRAIIRLKVL